MTSALVSNAVGDLVAERPSEATLDATLNLHHPCLRRRLPRLSTLLAKCGRAHGDERPELRDTRTTYERLRAALEAQLDEEDIHEENNIPFPRTLPLIAP